MDIKQEPLDNNKTTNIVKSEDGYHYDENTNVAGLGNCDFQHTTLKEETLDINEKPVTVSLEGESVKIKCATCGQVYNLKQSFIERARIDATEGSFRCSFCECKMGQLHACNICSFKAKVSSHLVNHMMIHTGEKPFACSLCEYRASHKYKLEGHMTQHTWKKPFACSICEYRTTMKCRLTIHMKKHTGEMPYECGLCNFKTSRYWNMKRHEKVHHKEI